MDLERQKEYFKDHEAKLSDYGNIKILDFKNPNSDEYRIRFVFEEDYCRLHISGDLGELTAVNYSNMTYERFSDFVRDAGYFAEKVKCHSRDIYSYDEDDAEADLKQYFNDHESAYDKIMADKNDWDTESERIDQVINKILCDFSPDMGIGSKGYDELSKYVSNAWEIAGDVGKRSTGILDLYLLAFKLAKENLKEHELDQKEIEETENDL